MKVMQILEEVAREHATNNSEFVMFMLDYIYFNAKLQACSEANKDKLTQRIKEFLVNKYNRIGVTA